MQFDKCLQCPAIKEGRCSGPKFMAMTAKELLSWTVKYQKMNGISNTQLAEWSGISKSTIDGMKYRDDIRHDTIYYILKALIEGTGGKWGEIPCVISIDDDENLSEAVARLEGEVQFLRETITFAEKQTEKQMKVKNRAIAALAISLGVALLVQIVDLIITHI